MVLKGDESLPRKGAALGDIYTTVRPPVPSVIRPNSVPILTALLISLQILMITHLTETNQSP